GEALVASFPPAILDRDVATVDPAEFAQSLHKRRGPFASGRTCALAQETDGRQLARLLRARRQRPCDSRTADPRYELTSPYLVEWHPDPVQPGTTWQDIRLTRVGQRTCQTFATCRVFDSALQFSSTVRNVCPTTAPLC